MATNMEVAARGLKIAQKERYDDFKVDIKTINTGSHLYVVRGLYTIEKGVLIEVTKYRVNNQLVGRLVIDRYSNYGIEYDRTVIGTLPESVVKVIKQFINIYNKVDYDIEDDRYFEICFIDEWGMYSELIKAKKKPTKESLLKKYKRLMEKYGFREIKEINEISKEQYYRWKAR